MPCRTATGRSCLLRGPDRHLKIHESRDNLLTPAVYPDMRSVRMHAHGNSDNVDQVMVLAPGQNAPCPDGPLVVRLTPRLDLSALVLGSDGTVRSEPDFVFYNAPKHPSGALTLSADDAEVHLNLDRLPKGTERVALAVSSDDDNSLDGMTITVATTQGVQVSFSPGPLGGVTAAVLLEVYRRTGAWKVRAVGQGWVTGLAGLATDFGIMVDDNPDKADPPDNAVTPERSHVISEIRPLMEQRARLTAELLSLRKQVRDAQAQLVQTSETALLQDLGFYQYSHPLDHAVDYQARLNIVRTQQKTAMRDGKAVRSRPGWTVNGSAKEGAALVRDFSKLMLRAYNTEADNCVRSVRPHSLTAATKRLEQTRNSILKLGAIMGVSIDDGYHEMRVRELRLVTDHQAKVAEEKEETRAERERLREDAKALAELHREEDRLLKERAHYEQVLERLDRNHDTSGAAKVRRDLQALDEVLQGIKEREANTRAGYVYVISNPGAFGKLMVKIGMTRRYNPMDRVHELGNASVPFRFDVHALIFSKDAVGLERALHREFESQRVNRVNLRREFFFASPAAVRDVLVRVGQDHLLEFNETAEALEWRQSEARRSAVGESEAETDAVTAQVHVRL